MPLLADGLAERDHRIQPRPEAIGVTEENDSIAIVVSEETGRISLVEDGNVELGLDPERLRERLKALLRVRRSDMDRREAWYSFG